MKLALHYFLRTAAETVNGGLEILPVSVLRINHYVDMFEARCGTEADYYEDSCDTYDDSILRSNWTW